MRVMPASTAVTIVGAGFGGICAAIRLVQAGIGDFLVLDRASGPGGVWHQNRYPGAACDVPSSLYSYSFVEDFEWAGTHGSWSEMVDYIEHCIDRFCIRDRILFNVEVERAEWSARKSAWTVETSQGRVESEFLISACGLFNRPSMPSIRDAETFGGPVFHSAQWQADFDARDRTIGVIGTGCSAAQFVPAIVELARQLVVFQRSACHVMPKAEREYSDDERIMYRLFPVLRALERSALEDGTDAFVQFQFDEAVRTRITGDILAGMAAQIGDPDKRARLLPTYPVGGKRPISSNAFLPALDRPNVTVVSDLIERLVPDGIVTRGGTVHPVDAIVFGTGFLAAEYLVPLTVVGEDGQILQDRWVDGAYAYHGMMIDSFPNFFMVYGPNSNAVGSILQMIEPQVDFIVSQIELAVQDGSVVAVDAATVIRFNEELQDALAKSIYGQKVSTNYFTAPGGKIVTQWPGSPRQFETAIAAIDGAALLTRVGGQGRASTRAEPAFEGERAFNAAAR